MRISLVATASLIAIAFTLPACTYGGGSTGNVNPQPSSAGAAVMGTGTQVNSGMTGSNSSGGGSAGSASGGGAGGAAGGATK